MSRWLWLVCPKPRDPAPKPQLGRQGRALAAGLLHLVTLLGTTVCTFYLYEQPNHQDATPEITLLSCWSFKGLAICQGPKEQSTSPGYLSPPRPPRLGGRDGVMPLDPFGCLLGGLCSQQDGLYSGSYMHRLSYSGQFPSLSRWGMTLVCPVASKKPWLSYAGTLTGSLRVLSVGRDYHSFRLTQWGHEAPSSTGPHSHKVCPLKSRSCG